VSFDFPIVNDDVLESNETFYLNIVPSNQVTPGTSVQATVTILNDDSKH